MPYKVIDPLTGNEIEITPSEDQQQAIDAVLHGKSKFYRISGPAGSGKSCIISILKSLLGALVTATTARAALNVGGITVDQVFCFSRFDWKIKNTTWLNKIMWECPDVIIIDEASMIGKEMATIIYSVAKSYGKTIILVGDWAQAQPVKEDWPIGTPLFTEAESIKLSINHRQSDGPYLKQLNSIRMGDVSDTEMHELFNSCVADAPDDDRFVRLYAINKMADAYNIDRLNGLMLRGGFSAFETKAEFYDARVRKPFEYNSSHIGKAIEDSNLSNNEKYCIGTRVVLTANCYGDGFVNSDSGEIVDIHSDEKVTEDEYGFVNIPKPNYFVVKLDRNQQNVIVRKIERQFKDGLGNPQYTVKGFPIRYGWAITIHRAQGMTVTRAYLDMDSLKYMPNKHGLAYVGLSRTKQIEGLLLSAWRPDMVHCDPEIRPLI